MTITITIDGPSGTGKTTVAKKVADALHFVYFDTGAMYRALTWWVMETQVSLEDAEGLSFVLNDFIFNIQEKDHKKHYFVGSVDVTESIRSREITARVSAVAALKQVRSHLLSIQHRFAEGQNAVFEGRDLGTVVFPKAQFKVFLTAEPRIRAERRLQELLLKDPIAIKGVSLEEVLEDLEKRDALDSTRQVAPLKCPEHAFVLDTSTLSIDEVVDRIVKEYRRVKR
ncbi:MAG: hypothetical protein RLZZ453_1143 [Chlamydiota bacterium]|jgi:cytidylate kinase